VSKTYDIGILFVGSVERRIFTYACVCVCV